MGKVTVMLSSTVSDLLDVRRSVGSALESTGLVDLVGVIPGTTTSTASSSYAATIDIAESCGAYILILGGRYGYETGNGKSATQLEYEAAYRADPTKVLVLRQTGVRRDAKQKAFMERVEDYHRGFFVSRFKTPSEAGPIAREAFTTWLVDRATVGKKLDYFDHFLRVASQRSPFPGAKREYRNTPDRIELTYEVLNRVYSVHFEKAQLFRDFWGSVFHLDQRFEEWRSNVTP